MFDRRCVVLRTCWLPLQDSQYCWDFTGVLSEEDKLQIKIDAVVVRLMSETVVFVFLSICEEILSWNVVQNEWDWSRAYEWEQWRKGNVNGSSGKTCKDDRQDGGKERGIKRPYDVNIAEQFADEKTEKKESLEHFPIEPNSPFCLIPFTLLATYLATNSFTSQSINLPPSQNPHPHNPIPQIHHFTTTVFFSSLSK